MGFTRTVVGLDRRDISVESGDIMGACFRVQSIVDSKGDHQIKSV